MDQRVMELRIKQWISVIEEQAKSGMGKGEWCAMHGIDRTSFFRWQKRVRQYLLDKYENQPSRLPSTTASDETDFVEMPSASVSPAGTEGQADLCSGDTAACGRSPSISIRYGDFSIDLGNDVDEGQLSRVLRVIKHAG